MIKQLIDLWKKDDLLQQAWQDSFRMLEIDREMYHAASRILRQGQGDEADDVLAQDAWVDAFEQDVRRKVLTHCAVRLGPDLVGGLILATIVIDIERIGDYTKNIVQLARSYPGPLQGGPLEADLQRVEQAVTEAFESTRRCLEDSDAEAAQQLLEQNRWVAQLCETRVQGLVHTPESGIGAGQAAALALYLRHLKRIHGHLGDIATAVVQPFDRIGVKP